MLPPVPGHVGRKGIDVCDKGIRLQTETNLLRLLDTDGFARFVKGNRGRDAGFHLPQPLEQRLVLGAQGDHLCRGGWNAGCEWHEREYHRRR